MLHPKTEKSSYVKTKVFGVKHDNMLQNVAVMM